MSAPPSLSRPTPRRPGCASRNSNPAPTPLWRYEVALVDGLLGVNRVVTLLRQRNYEVTWLHADLGSGADAGRREPVSIPVTMVVAGTERDAELLDQRLLRLPCTLDVRRQRGELPAHAV